VNSYTTSVQAVPSVAYTGGGAFVVTWASANQDGMQGGIFGQRYDSSGAPTGLEFRVNAYTTNAQYSAHVAASAGDFMVVWDSNYQNNARPAGAVAAARPSPLGLGFGHGVIGQLFASSGPALGSDFRVNSYTSRGQSYMRIGADSAGTFLVIWASDGQDGSNFGVYGQRYCTVPLTAVSISVMGSTMLSCPNGSGGTASVSETGGGPATHQWGFRTMSGGTVTAIPMETGPTYALSGADFPGPGSYFLVETTTPSCGGPLVSNEVMVGVAADAAAPLVTAPTAVSTTQTLCQ